MAARNPEQRSASASLAAIQRHRPDDVDALDAARRDLAAARLAAYVERTVAEAPPLTPEQRDRIALLLRGGDAA